MRRREWPTLNWASLLLAVLTACGSGGSDDGSTTPELATVSTLAYVVTECRTNAEAATIRQSLQIRQGEQGPITVVEHSADIAPSAGFSCLSAGFIRHGPAFGEIGVFRRLGVTPDGSQVVFEVTDEVTDFVDYSLVFPPNALPPEQKGIFAVRADGSGLHRVGPASSVVSYHQSLFPFSPNGRTIAYVDRGPSRDNEDAAQILTLDLVTGERRQVTQLPPASGDFFQDTSRPFFNDDQTITFYTLADADGDHPDGESIVVTVKTDGSGLTVAPPNIAIPRSEVLTSFRITSSELDAATLTVEGEPDNPFGSFQSITEVFAIDRDNNILQLTNFHRSDTLSPMVSADGQRVVFSASADPLGTNPTGTCQLFSIDRNGGDPPQQLTNFEEHPVGRPSIGCSFGPRPGGCAAYGSSDLRSDAIVFYSSCDPFGTNPYGAQVFAIHSDGTGLRQITNTQGYTNAGTVELPYPIAWPGARLR